jgi:hypothetical protein
MGAALTGGAAVGAVTGARALADRAASTPFGAVATQVSLAGVADSAGSDPEGVDGALAPAFVAVAAGAGGGAVELLGLADGCVAWPICGTAFWSAAALASVGGLRTSDAAWGAAPGLGRVGAWVATAAKLGPCVGLAGEGTVVASARGVCVAAGVNCACIADDSPGSFALRRRTVGFAPETASAWGADAGGEVGAPARAGVGAAKVAVSRSSAFGCAFPAAVGRGGWADALDGLGEGGVGDVDAGAAASPADEGSAWAASCGAAKAMVGAVETGWEAWDPGAWGCEPRRSGSNDAGANDAGDSGAAASASGAGAWDAVDASAGTGGWAWGAPPWEAPDWAGAGS